jgi:hypothetical protein
MVELLTFELSFLGHSDAKGYVAYVPGLRTPPRVLLVPKISILPNRGFEYSRQNLEYSNPYTERKNRHG